MATTRERWRRGSSRLGIPRTHHHRVRLLLPSPLRRTRTAAARRLPRRRTQRGAFTTLATRATRLMSKWPLPHRHVKHRSSMNQEKIRWLNDKRMGPLRWWDLRRPRVVGESLVLRRSGQRTMRRDARQHDQNEKHQLGPWGRAVLSHLDPRLWLPLLVPFVLVNLDRPIGSRRPQPVLPARQPQLHRRHPL